MGMAAALIALSLHEGDDVAVVTQAGEIGELCSVSGPGGSCEIVLLTQVPFGHKVSINDIREGQPVRKYGEPIGVATQTIAAGSHVHVHNLAGYRNTLRGDHK